MFINTVLVDIKRNTNTITRYVNQYEIELLREIHGNDDRFVVHEKDIKVIEVDLNIADEYQRLSNLYRRDSDVFFRVFRNERDLKNAIESSISNGEEPNDEETSVLKEPKKVVLKKQAKVSV